MEQLFFEKLDNQMIKQNEMIDEQAIDQNLMVGEPEISDKIGEQENSYQNRNIIILAIYYNKNQLTPTKYR